MARKIAVIGMGNVGAAVAHHLVSAGLVDDLALFDIREAKVEADALDFQDSMANLDYHTNITVNDYTELDDTDVIISAVGNVELLDTPVKNRMAELDYTGAAVEKIATKIKNTKFSGIIVVISNPTDVMTDAYQKITGYPKDRVIGTGALLDSARMKRAVGEKLNVDPRSISGYNLGEHGNSQFTAWSTVRVLGRPITELMHSENVDLEELNEVTRMAGFKVYQGKKYTSYGISAATVRLAMAILNDSHEELPVSNYREDYGVYLSYPAIVGRSGIEHQVHLDLTEEEEKKLRASADYIKKHLKY